MKTLILRQSRERSLAYCHAWQQANQVDTGRFFSRIKQLLFLNYGKNTKTKVWYGKEELPKIISQIGKRVNQVAYLERVKREFWTFLQELLVYVREERKAGNLEDLKQYYHNWIRWWAPMAVIFVVAEAETSSQEAKEETIKIRIETERYSEKIDRTFLRMFTALRPEYKEIASLLTPEEMFRDDSLSEEEIQQIKTREQGYVFYNGKVYPLRKLPEVLQKNRLKLGEEEISRLAVIKGSIAYPGKAQGRVILVLSKSRLREVQEGNILVTEMTSPDYVPILKKVAAIVTDEGGITSHAAIISRELNIPCLVGTQYATKVLKDGDLVEVDAYKGIVRKLEK